MILLRLLFPSKTPANVGCMKPKLINHYSLTLFSYWKTNRLNPTIENLNIYEGRATLVKKLFFEYERTEELKVIKRSHLGYFYKLLNNRLTWKSGVVGPLRFDSGELATSDTVKAIALDEYLCSLFYS
jgi:hypothetical protein